MRETGAVWRDGGEIGTVLTAGSSPRTNSSRRLPSTCARVRSCCSAFLCVLESPVSKKKATDTPQVLWRGIPDNEIKEWKERTITQHEMGLDWRRA